MTKMMMTMMTMTIIKTAITKNRVLMVSLAETIARGLLHSRGRTRITLTRLTRVAQAQRTRATQRMMMTTTVTTRRKVSTILSKIIARVHTAAQVEMSRPQHTRVISRIILNEIANRITETSIDRTTSHISAMQQAMLQLRVAVTAQRRARPSIVLTHRIHSPTIHQMHNLLGDRVGRAHGVMRVMVAPQLTMQLVVSNHRRAHSSQVEQTPSNHRNSISQQSEQI
jgi:hypothetical protein